MSDEQEKRGDEPPNADEPPVRPPFRLQRRPAIPGESRRGAPGAGPPLRRSMEREEFEQLVAEAVAMLPAEFRQRMVNIEVLVDDWATPAQRRSVGLRPNETLFGLYEGVPHTRRSTHYNLAMPDRIWIFQGPIERAYGGDRERLRREVGRVVLHEIAHHFGIDDDRLEELGY
jgi:predicted Zn-dependent protease with MMP-like domain